MKRTALTAGIVCCLMMFAGCGSDERSSVSKKNFDRLKMGMPYEEVITILGPGNKCDSAAGDRSCLWGDEKKNIGVQFTGGKAVFFTSRGL
jgi:hypothetical protein